jgi:hypothetical protein
MMNYIDHFKQLYFAINDGCFSMGYLIYSMFFIKSGWVFLALDGCFNNFLADEVLLMC